MIKPDEFMPSLRHLVPVPFSRKKSSNQTDPVAVEPLQAGAFFSLPSEVWIVIFQKLDYADLVKCTSVCSLFKELISQTSSLQYTIELGATNQLNNPYCNLSSQRKLELLERQQKAWFDLRWSRKFQLPMLHGGLWELYGGILGQSDSDGNLVFNQLPSEIRGIEAKEWKLGPESVGGIDIRDFSMDPSQDLLVLIERPSWPILEGQPPHRVHIRSLSNGNIHPRATNCPVLTFRSLLATRNPSYSIQLFGDLVGLLVSGELAIWDWKSGQLMIHLSTTPSESFKLLSRDWVTFGCNSEATQPFATAINLKEQGPETCKWQSVKQRFQFNYPQMKQRKARLLAVNVVSDPGPAWEPSSLPSQTPFYRDAEAFILVFQIRYQTKSYHVSEFTHIVPSQHLRSVIEDRVTGVEGVVEVDWEDWGPINTQLLEPKAQLSDVWLCFVHGTRFAFQEYGEEDMYEGRVLDFNQQTVRRWPMEVNPSLSALDVISKRKAVNKRWSRAITTDLEYRAPRFAEEDVSGDGTVLMCSEDNLVLVDDEKSTYHVYVF